MGAERGSPVSQGEVWPGQQDGLAWAARMVEPGIHVGCLPFPSLPDTGACAHIPLIPQEHLKPLQEATVPLPCPAPP